MKLQTYQIFPTSTNIRQHGHTMECVNNFNVAKFGKEVTDATECKIGDHWKVS